MTSALQPDIEALFERFDEEADTIIDGVLIGKDVAASALLADGLAIRLVQWLLGESVPQADCLTVAASLVTELNTLRRNFTNDMPDQ
jgi:hypothetical protein